MADGEFPRAQPAPIIHRRDPAAGSLVFLAVLVVLFALHLQDDRLAVTEADDLVRLKMVLGALVFAGNQQERPVVSHVTENMVRLHLQVEGGGLFPGAVQNDGVDVGVLRTVDVPFRREVHIACSKP